MKLLYFFLILFLIGCASIKPPDSPKAYKFVKIVSVDKDGTQTTQYIGIIK